AFLAGWLYQFYAKDWMSWLGEFRGTRIIGALLAAPIMVWFWTWTADGNHEVLAKASAAQSIFLFMPRFIEASKIGGVIALLLLQGLKRVPVIMTIQELV
ncbi:energy coupling factor transporter S component ThiW, partial [Streptococcus agalactiae]|uniref:energy coupling factor transporter S component ThiW n=1 Tax=Streptococcus agalactiae TaxID=1311 RepID=UPI000FAB82E3